MKPGRNDPCSCGSGKKFKHCCEGKIVSRPVSPSPAELNQLVALDKARRYAELESRARLTVGQYPASGPVWKLLGNALQMQGKNALTAFQKTAELMPNDADAAWNLGNTLYALDRFNEAATVFRRVAKLKPDFAGAFHNLGLALENLGQLDDAVDSYRRALRLAPNSAITYSNLGTVLGRNGQRDDAAASFYRALEIKPSYVEAMLGLANLHAESGETAKAEEIIRNVLDIDANNLDARYKLAIFQKAKPGDENLTALIAADEATRKNPIPLPYKDAIALHFALGKCFDDLGDHDRAFPHFLEGCKLKRSRINYDAARISKQFDDVIRAFDSGFIERLRGAGNPSGLPIFVLGMPRSGTTLTEQIIASHPDVHGAGELLDMPQIAKRAVAGVSEFPGNLLALDQVTLARWADDYIAGLRQHAPEAKHITDKMPENFWIVGLIHLMLPNAKIIHISRNPVDNCLSCFTTLFTSAIEYTYDLAELGRYYADYARLMDHWRKVLPAGAFLDVRYEDIIADQEAQARRIIDFCGMEWSDDCLNFHKLNRSVSTASLAQVRRPIYKSSVERWRPYEKYLGPLLDALGDLAPIRNP